MSSSAAAGSFPGRSDSARKWKWPTSWPRSTGGRGLGTEAARGIVRYAVGQLGLSRLVCLVAPGNQASANVARNIGMIPEAEMEDDDGPFVLYSMSAV